jgi:hypothetical protein
MRPPMAVITAAIAVRIPGIVSKNEGCFEFGTVPVPSPGAGVVVEPEDDDAIGLVPCGGASASENESAGVGLCAGGLVWPCPRAGVC